MSQKNEMKDAIEEAIDSYFSKKIKKINLYMLPQYLWLIVLYYLMLNYILDFSSSERVRSTFDIEEVLLPEVIIEYNSLILEYFELWNPFIYFLSVGLLISGLIVGLLGNIPYVNQFKVIRYNSAYGLAVFIWFFLIAMTYSLYSTTAVWFPLFIIIPMIISVAKEAIAVIIKKYLKEILLKLDR